MKTADLTGAALDWAVTKCEGFNADLREGGKWGRWGWDTDWGQGGPIIERECIGIWAYEWNEQGEPEVGWYAEDKDGGRVQTGPTPLVAAMRCRVASVLGDDVDVPEELE